MPNEPTRAPERARKRALGKIRREALIERREAYFDLLVAGYSIEQIASAMKKSPATVRRVIGQALAKRRLDAPEDYARLQVARLTKALRCADVSLEEGDLKAIAPFVKVVRELNLYHGVNFGSARLDVSSRILLVHSYRVIRRMRYGPGSTWERHNDRGGPSSDTA